MVAVTAAVEMGARRLVIAAVLLTAGLCAARLLVIGEFGLFLDEAYYWVWSQHLSASYYDHPPLIAFAIRLGTVLFGDGAFGVRIVGALSVAVDAWLIYAITRVVSDSRRTAAWATIFFNVTTLAAAAVLTVPDQPMMVFWLGALYGLVRIARGGSGWWWLLVGAMGGLGALSKYTLLFLAVAVLLWLVMIPSQRHWLRRPWPYLAALLATALFAPVLWWNATHDWSSFALHLNRTGYGFAGWRWDSFGVHLLLYPLMLGPPVFVLAVLGVGQALRAGWRSDPAKALLLLTMVPLPLYLAWHSLSEWIGGHWLSPIVASGVIFAALAAERTAPAARRLVAFCRRAAVPFGLAAAGIVYLALVETFLPLPAGADVTARFRGWDAFAEDADRLRREAGADYFVTTDYATAAILRYQLRETVPVVQLDEPERWSYLDYDPALGDPNATALYVTRWSSPSEMIRASRFFASVAPGGVVTRPIRDDRVETVPALIVSDPRNRFRLLLDPE
ncbi:MAG: glycosyltransferase family 39 protein [Bauldia sp.]|nr:glycosyltransferase family 39 protein [Bauldia sp.]